MIELMQTHAPDIVACCRAALDGATSDLGFFVLGDAYAQAPAISLDYAVAEKTPNMACVPLNAPWSDVGSWSALWDFLAKDESGNVMQGDGENHRQGFEQQPRL